jgi:hypothetical protein
MYAHVVSIILSRTDKATDLFYPLARCISPEELLQTVFWR